MISEDTIKLLGECNSGIKMGVSSINDALPSVTDERLKCLLTLCKKEHTKIGYETHELLNKYHDSGKEPNPIAKGMSWMKTNIMLSLDKSDNTVADLITDGCNMGVKSLNKFLNQYNEADEKAKDIAKRLINIEEKLAVDIRGYL